MLAEIMWILQHANRDVEKYREQYNVLIYALVVSFPLGLCFFALSGGMHSNEYPSCLNYILSHIQKLSGTHSHLHYSKMSLWLEFY